MMNLCAATAARNAVADRDSDRERQKARSVCLTPTLLFCFPECAVGGSDERSLQSADQLFQGSIALR